MKLNQWITLCILTAGTALALTPQQACAQTAEQPAKGAGQPVLSGFTFTPFVLIAGGYNDNIFATASQPQSDTILSLSPGLDIKYQSARTNFNFDYSFTAEKYARHSNLSTWDARQQGLFGINHYFTRRFKAGITASYYETHDPGELTPTTGLVLTRSKATRITVKPSFTYDFSEVTSMNVFYERTRENVDLGPRTDIGTASGAITHQLGPSDSLQTQVQNVSYQFNDGTHVSSNVVTLGWTHAISQEATFVLSAGPRDTEGRIVPEALASIRYNSDNTDYSLSYTRSQTVVIGETGVVNTQGLEASFGFVPARHWSIGFSPGYFHDYGPDLNADIYHLGFYTTYALSTALSIGLTYDYSRQHGEFGVAGQPVITRNAVTLALRWALPSPGERLPTRTVPAPIGGIPAQ